MNNETTSLSPYHISISIAIAMVCYGYTIQMPSAIRIQIIVPLLVRINKCSNNCKINGLANADNVFTSIVVNERFSAVPEVLYGEKVNTTMVIGNLSPKQISTLRTILRSNKIVKTIRKEVDTCLIRKIGVVEFTR
jgi:hypothetical protein